MDSSFKTKWLSSRAIWAHITLLVVVPLFFILADWQIHRALSGNLLSYAYSIEWPVFAIYAFYTWYKIIHDEHKEIPKTVKRQIGAPGIPQIDPASPKRQALFSNAENKSNRLDQNSSALKIGDGPEIQSGESTDLEEDFVEVEIEDEDLIAYNEYLSQLNNENKRKSWF